MKYTIMFLLLLGLSCTPQKENKPTKNDQEENTNAQFITILGIAQDAGYPQAGCQKECCRNLWDAARPKKQVCSIGIIDKEAEKSWIIEATPDFKHQIAELAGKTETKSENYLPSGILLTHAHMGHYTGLIHLGREAMGTNQVPVYAMPKMKAYLENNGPWSQLVELKNIELQALQADSTIHLSKSIKITPFLVPHRDEFSETVGYKIEGSKKAVLFIPDIDKWNKWERDIREEVSKVDLALLDGTFYQNGEIKGRDMSLIPHPFIEETVALFRDASIEEKRKLCFIHFNHTNPVMRETEERKALLKKGFLIADEGMNFGL